MPKKRSRHSGGTPQLPTNKAVRRSDAAGPSTFADDGGGEGSGRDDRDGAAVLSRNARATTPPSPSLRRLIPEHAFNSRLCKHLLFDVHPTELEAAQPWLKPPHLRECHGALLGDIAKEIARIAESIATTDDPELQRGWPESIMKLLEKDTDKRPDSTKAAEGAAATLAFLGKKQLVKVKHYMYATLSMDRSIRNKYLTPEACFGICVICCDETAPANDESDETDDPELKSWASCDLCGCWAHQSCMSEQVRNGKAEMTLSPTGHGTISAQCPSCTEYNRLDPLCVEVTSKDVVLRLLDGCESTVQSVLRDGTGILANKLPDNFRERLISSGFHYVLDLVQEGLDIVRNKLCFVPADMVDNTLRYLMIGPVGAGKSLKGDLMCIRAPGDPTQYHQDAPCSLPDDFIKTQLQAGRKSSQIIRYAIEFPEESLMKSLFDESG